MQLGYEPLLATLPPKLAKASDRTRTTYLKAHAEALAGIVGRCEAFGDTAIAQSCYACLMAVRRRQAELRLVVIPADG